MPNAIKQKSIHPLHIIGIRIPIRKTVAGELLVRAENTVYGTMPRLDRRRQHSNLHVNGVLKLLRTINHIEDILQILINLLTNKLNGIWLWGKAIRFHILRQMTNVQKINNGMLTRAVFDYRGHGHTFDIRQIIVNDDDARLILAHSGKAIQSASCGMNKCRIVQPMGKFFSCIFI